MRHHVLTLNTRARSDAASSRISRSSWLNADSRLLSMSISPSTPFFPFIGTTISDLVAAKHMRYRGSLLTSGTTIVAPSLAAEPQIPCPIGILRCSVSSSCIRLQYQIVFSHEVDSYPVEMIRTLSLYLHGHRQCLG